MNDAAAARAVPTMTRSLLVGGFGFGMASLCVFATVAFGEGWMYERLGLAGAYLAWILMFVLLGGGVFVPLVRRTCPLVRWYLLFSGTYKHM